MPSTDDPGDPPQDALRARLARVTDPSVVARDARARAFALGVVLGAIAVPVLVVVQGWWPRTASNTTFALGALVLGFATLSWSAAVMLGPAIEDLQAYMDIARGWTEAGARQAFAILAALGVGTMTGSVLGTMLVAAL